MLSFKRLWKEKAEKYAKSYMHGVIWTLVTWVYRFSILINAHLNVCILCKFISIQWSRWSSWHCFHRLHLICQPIILSTNMNHVAYLSEQLRRSSFSFYSGSPNFNKVKQQKTRWSWESVLVILTTEQGLFSSLL